MSPTTAAEALERLKQGNRRFIENNMSSVISEERRVEVAKAQRPFAIVLGCSDSRAPAELVFDQGLGDIFVIRVAGNIVAPSQVGSVEFAAEQFGTQLVVVMGHSGCGAINATIETIERERLSETGPVSRNLMSIVDRIRPSVEPLTRLTAAKDRATLFEEAVRANVLASCEGLRRGSAVLEHLIAQGHLTVIGAEYDLESGSVTFFDDS